MANVSLILALASPLIHARLRAELARDPDILILCDTDNAAKAAEEIALQHPPIVLVDREMVLNPALGRLAKPLPAIVFVNVHREGVPVGHVLPIAGSLAFDARPGEISRILRGVLDNANAQAAAAPVQTPEVSILKSRFTLAEHSGPGVRVKGSAHVERREPVFIEKAPVPSKTSQLTKTGFLRSVFDPARGGDGAALPAREDVPVIAVARRRPK